MVTGTTWMLSSFGPPQKQSWTGHILLLQLRLCVRLRGDRLELIGKRMAVATASSGSIGALSSSSCVQGWRVRFSTKVKVGPTVTYEAGFTPLRLLIVSAIWNFDRCAREVSTMIC